MSSPDYFELCLAPFIIALIAVWIIHPIIVKIARAKGIMDRPNARKLQKQPVPLLGGTVVFFGIFIGFTCSNSSTSNSELFLLLTGMLLMLYLGTIDDILTLNPINRLLVEMGTILLLIYLGEGYEIERLYGLGGIDQLPHWISVPLTLLVMAGIVNSINLIDGVDGLSSGFGIMACLLFSIAFFVLEDYPMVLLCASTIGALTLFFLYNVFGNSSKMFIGDGGTLLLGFILAVSVVRLIYKAELTIPYTKYDQASIIPFTLAVLAIPVFDTFRVMFLRFKSGFSPFHPDKQHLHHLFVEMGFSHIATTGCILTINLIIVSIWTLGLQNGWSAEVQTIVIVTTAWLATFGLYNVCSQFKERHPERFGRMVAYIRVKQPQDDRGWFKTMQKIMDRI